jgi:hypothetical protein
MKRLRQLLTRVVSTNDGEREFIVAKKAYPLRINEEVLNAMQGWAEDELRSLNAQIEYVLREALRKSGRSKKAQPRVVELPEQNS